MSDPTSRTRRLADSPALKFPFRVDASGPIGSDRAEHLRDQIEQVLFTVPGERVFRPEFGAGLATLVFEPNRSALWELTRRRLQAALADALRGEVEPQSIEVDVSGTEERLDVVVRYRLTTVGAAQEQAFSVGGHRA